MALTLTRSLQEGLQHTSFLLAPAWLTLLVGGHLFPHPPSLSSLCSFLHTCSARKAHLKSYPCACLPEFLAHWLAAGPRVPLELGVLRRLSFEHCAP